MTQKTFLGAVQVSQEMINDVIFLCESRTKSSYFTRQGRNNKMTFANMIWFCLNFVRKSLQIELNDFFQQLHPGETSITKQGFSQARQKLSPIAFIKLTDAVTTWFYEDGCRNTFHGYRLLGVDGSVLKLNNVPALREAFGFSENGTGTYARAYIATLYDLENKLTIASTITKYATPERQVALGLLEKLQQLGQQKELILFDRGYPSRTMFSYLEAHQMKFLMRCPSFAMKEINQSTRPDQRIRMMAQGDLISLRVLRFLLDSGEEEILVTNLLEEELDMQFFKELYFKRWGIEGYYRELKSPLQLENFTGATPIAVEQDFYASVYLHNMIALAKHEANERISHQVQQVKKRKYAYEVNTNLLIGTLKTSLLPMLLETNLSKREAMFHRMMEEVVRHKIPIRPGRKSERRMKNRTNKYAYNNKRCI